MPPVRGAPGYRHGPAWVRGSAEQGGMLIGSGERRSSYIRRPAFPRHPAPTVSDLPVPMRHLFAALSVADRLPQVEVAVASAVRRWYSVASRR